MRLAPLTALLLCPATVGAQAVGAPAPREVVVRSGAPSPAGGAGRLGLSVSLGPGFSRAGFSGGAGELGLSGAVAVASARASLRLHRWVAVQLGAAGALSVAPRVRAGTPQYLELQGVSGFGLLGAGVALGPREGGLRLSLLGGVGWTLARIDSASGARSGAGAGGGGFVELSHHWALAGRWTLGLGATAWALLGRDANDWLGHGTAWSVLGGGLVASVATR